MHYRERHIAGKRALFLENHDSFSWNVVDRLPLPRTAVQVVSSGPSLGPTRLRRYVEDADVVVIGPGPTDPLRAGIVTAVLIAAELGKPTLGICLGHQAIGLAFGARIARTTPMHGKQSEIEFVPSRLFPGITGRLIGMRYHSLVLEAVAPPLRVIARTADGLVMAAEHQHLPMAGLQFHPDSYGTPRGERIIGAFFTAVAGA